MKETSKIMLSVIFLILLFIMIVGYIMNFQNLFQYWVDGSLSNISIRWFISLVGVFFAPLGVVTGYIW